MKRKKRARKAKSVALAIPPAPPPAEGTPAGVFVPLPPEMSEAVARYAAAWTVISGAIERPKEVNVADLVSTIVGAARGLERDAARVRNALNRRRR